MWKQGLVSACALIAVAMPVHAADRAGGVAKSDAEFAQQIAIHHQAGIDMAQLCQGKARRNELKAFCAKASSQMQSDTRQLATLSGGGAKSSMSPEPHDQHQKTMKELWARADGNDFDYHFVPDMTRHHENSMRELQECQKQASSDGLKTLCGKMASAQQEEIKQLRQWQASWAGEQSQSTR